MFNSTPNLHLFEVVIILHFTLDFMAQHSTILPAPPLSCGLSVLFALDLICE